MKLAQDYSDLDISDVDISRQKRIPRQKKIFGDNSSSASDDSDQNNNTTSENEQVNKKKTLPAPPSLPKSFIVNKPINNEIMLSEEFYPNCNKNIIKETLVTSDTPGKS